MSRLRTQLGATAFVVAVVSSSAAQAIPCTPPSCLLSDLQGFVNSNDVGNGAAAGNNTFTGIDLGFHWRSWADFDLTGVSGIVDSAELVVFSTTVPSGSILVEIHDVSTPLGNLKTTTPGAGTYVDLGTGDLYASGMLGNGTSLLLPLSSDAVADINSALGGNFLVGYAAPRLDEATATRDTTIGVVTNGSALNYQPAQLILSFAGQVPEAGTLALVAVALGGLAWSRRKLI
jgi:PEP-CTERM motif